MLLVQTLAHGGLYYSNERMADLPSQWRGFLLDHKAMRSIAIKPSAGNPASPLRERYLAAAERLEKSGKDRKLSADELADLGAIYVRLGEASKAVKVLREAQGTYANHFAIAANLGTAWQMAGELKQAELALIQAVKLAPGDLKRVEELHLKLVRLRMQKQPGLAEIENLLGVRWVADDGSYFPGKLASAQQKKVSEETVALVQQLALTLPSDGYLLWQLSELANYYGDFGSAAAMMDGCVTQFGMSTPEFRSKRQLTRLAAEEQKKKLPEEAEGEHAVQTIGTLKAMSKRPLATKFDESTLPAISATDANQVPWALLGDTTIDKKSRPAFPKYLKELVGKQVSLTGFMQPVDGDQEVATFMLIENPVGCWYCEMPDVNQIVYVELPDARTTPFTRQGIRVTGKLALNFDDPEDFFFAIRDAVVHEVD
jgi:hypothetical protein